MSPWHGTQLKHRDNFAFYLSPSCGTPLITSDALPTGYSIVTITSYTEEMSLPKKIECLNQVFRFGFDLFMC
jgi:hypothetical protein